MRIRGDVRDLDQVGVGSPPWQGVTRVGLGIALAYRPSPITPFPDRTGLTGRAGRRSRPTPACVGGSGSDVDPSPTPSIELRDALAERRRLGGQPRHVDGTDEEAVLLPLLDVERVLELARLRHRLEAPAADRNEDLGELERHLAGRLPFQVDDATGPLPDVQLDLRRLGVDGVEGRRGRDRRVVVEENACRLTDLRAGRLIEGELGSRE